ncbi:MAG: tetratricopeptide repeat protein [Parcubacteria group bacterium]|nr:tetratricopeptide repeat protein [Parcubacteria group bacterium]
MKKHLFENPLVRKIFPAVVLCLAVLAVYFNSLHNTFLWDDDSGILTNKYIKEWRYFLNFFSEGMYAGSGALSVYWRPAVLSVFSIEWRMFHEWVVGYHAVNILLHAIDATLIFYLFRSLFNKTLLAFMAAFLFAVHPLQTEAVTYISGIADPLSVLFILLGTFTYLKAQTNPDKRRLFLLATFLLFIFALMSKESAIMMPGLLFLADLYAQKSDTSLWKKMTAAFKRVLPFLCVLAVYIIARLTIFDLTKDLPPSPLFFPLYERVLTFFHAFSVYLRLMFAPLHLHMEWALPIGRSIFTPQIATGGFFLIFLLGIIVTQIQKRPEVSFGLVWFFVALSPNTNIFLPTTALLSEHWLYLSLPGFFFAFFAAIEKITRKWSYRPILSALFIAWVVWLGNLTILRNRDWSDPITFFTKTLTDAPHSYRAALNLGITYEKRGEQQAALKYYEQSLTSRETEIGYFMRAELYQKMGRESEALRDHKRSFELNPAYSPSYRFLTDYFTSHAEHEKAREVLEIRADHTPDLIEAQRLFLMLFTLANQEHNEALKQKYMEKITANESIIQDKPLVKFGTFLNAYLDKN